MRTPADYLVAIQDARRDLIARIETESLRDSQWAGPWAALVTAEFEFASAACVACGYPALVLPQVSIGSTDDVIRTLHELGAVSEGRLKYVTAEDLIRPHALYGTVAGLMDVCARVIAAYGTSDSA